MMADAFAAVQPPDALWKAYLAEIARLQEKGSITSDEYYALRHTLSAKRVLMDLTAGDPLAFTEGTVAEVLKVAKEHLRADLQNELGQERRKRESAESTANHMEQREVGRRTRITARSARWARFISRGVSVVLVIILTAGAVLTFPWSLPNLRDAWYRYLTTGLISLFFMFTVASIAWGTSVASAVRTMEKKLGNALNHLLTRISE